MDSVYVPFVLLFFEDTDTNEPFCALLGDTWRFTLGGLGVKPNAPVGFRHLNNLDLINNARIAGKIASYAAFATAAVGRREGIT